VRTFIYTVLGYIYVYIYFTVVSKREGNRKANRPHRLRIFLPYGECGSFETLTEVSLIIQVFWNMTQCIFVNKGWPQFG